MTDLLRIERKQKGLMRKVARVTPDDPNGLVTSNGLKFGNIQTAMELIQREYENAAYVHDSDALCEAYSTLRGIMERDRSREP